MISNLTRHSELGFWVAALIILASTDPSHPPLLDLCIFKWAGFVCPGCGLGHGIAHLLDFDFLAAVDAHPLAPFAVVAMVRRVWQLLPEGFRPFNPTNQQ